MVTRKAEDHHHTGEQIRGYLEDALLICDEHELTPADRAAVLPSLLTLLSSKQVFYEQMAAPIVLPENRRG